MHTNSNAPTQKCGHCDQPMQQVACLACDGKGEQRVWLFFKRTCEVCHGSGTVIRCPNEYQHIISDLKLKLRPAPQTLYRNFQSTPSIKPFSLAQKPPMKPKHPPVPPPWHPSYPNPWHPNHPRNPKNQPFSPLNPNSPTNLNNPRHPFNRNNPVNRK